jgi:hypothetical protein
VVGFDIARTTNPAPSLGVAQSIVNLGRIPREPTLAGDDGRVWRFTIDAFRVAWLVQYPVWLFATVGVLVTRRKARRLDAAHGVVPRPLREVFAGVRGGPDPPHPGLLGRRARAVGPARAGHGAA